MKTIPSIPVNHTGTSITNFLSLVLIPGLAAWLYHYLKALFNQEAISIDANIWPLLLLSFTCWLFVVSAAYFSIEGNTNRSGSREGDGGTEGR